MKDFFYRVASESSRGWWWWDGTCLESPLLKGRVWGKKMWLVSSSGWPLAPSFLSGCVFLLHFSFTWWVRSRGREWVEGGGSYVYTCMWSVRTVVVYEVECLGGSLKCLWNWIVRDLYEICKMRRGRSSVSLCLACWVCIKCRMWISVKKCGL